MGNTAAVVHTCCPQNHAVHRRPAALLAVNPQQSNSRNKQGRICNVHLNASNWFKDLSSIRGLELICFLVGRFITTHAPRHARAFIFHLNARARFDIFHGARVCVDFCLNARACVDICFSTHGRALRFVSTHGRALRFFSTHGRALILFSTHARSFRLNPYGMLVLCGVHCDKYRRAPVCCEYLNVRACQRDLT